MNQNIPARLSRSNFDRFFSIIRQSADLGRTLQVSTESLAPTTVAARLRDALLSYRRFHWGDESPRPEITCLSVYTDRNGGVFIGTVPPREVVEEPAAVVQLVKQDLPTPWTLEELRALCLLLHTKKISGPMRVPQVSPDHCFELETHFDIAITNDKDASIIF